MNDIYKISDGVSTVIALLEEIARYYWGQTLVIATAKTGSCF